MKVLIVTPFYPFPENNNGVNKIVVNLIKHNRYYNADVLSLYNLQDESYFSCEKNFESIGFDDTIHYIHRYKIEYARDHLYRKAIQRTNYSVGNAMYYTTLTVVVGFSILTLSNLIPTIYFGLLTMVVMIAALVADLILLPKLLLILKPFKQ
jgi:hypothetical protein